MCLGNVLGAQWETEVFDLEFLNLTAENADDVLQILLPTEDWGDGTLGEVCF